MEMPRQTSKKANEQYKANQVRASQSASVWHELGMLGLKIVVVVVLTVILFTFVYGIHYNAEPGMNPAVKDGDLVLYYRLSKNYNARDLAIVKFQGETQVRRVIATTGDTVDITEQGLIINGALQLERDIYETTECYVDGPAFPMTLGHNQVFVLGDSRENAIDSRLYGPVDKDDTFGTVITIVRRRNW